MSEAKDRNLREELRELGIISIEGPGLLTEKSVFSALDAIREVMSGGMRIANGNISKCYKNRK